MKIQLSVWYCWTDTLRSKCKRFGCFEEYCTNWFWDVSPFINSFRFPCLCCPIRNAHTLYADIANRAMILSPPCDAWWCEASHHLASEHIRSRTSIDKIDINYCVGDSFRIQSNRRSFRSGSSCELAGASRAGQLMNPITLLDIVIKGDRLDELLFSGDPRRYASARHYVLRPPIFWIQWKMPLLPDPQCTRSLRRHCEPSDDLVSSLWCMVMRGVASPCIGTHSFAREHR